jgi:hypothetical protein
VNHITDRSIHIKSVISTETQYKSLILEHNNYPFQIQFLELKSFLAEGDLDKYATKFAKIPEKQKGVFPCEFLDTQNYVSELNKQELFQHQDFKSSLKQKNISESEYNTYKRLSKNKNRLEYLEWYNTQDVLIMCPIIDFLIHKFEEYDIYMLRNISLSSCTDQVKFAMTYKDFNINSNYSDKYFKKKIENYNIQDTCTKRCILRNIIMDNFNYFQDSLFLAKYYICYAGFTSSNKQTLDRKNNRIGHTKDNVEWCCNYCNSVKADRDENILVCLFN